MTNHSLHCSGLSLQRGNQQVLTDIKFAARPGECIALAGANGAGKTTLLKCFMGLFPEATGEIILSERDPRLTSPKILSTFYAYAPQSPHSTWDFTVKEFSNLSLKPSLYFHWLDRFALIHKRDKKLSELSGGERKAVHLSLSLSSYVPTKESTVLLDEPTASLDICRTDILYEVIQELVNQGATVITATHDLAFAQKCQRALLLKDGKLMADGLANETLTPEIISEIWGFSAPVS